MRVAYYFDSKRNAFLLTGGDKKGKDQDKFYKDLIAESEIIVENHEKELEDEECNKNDYINLTNVKLCNINDVFDGICESESNFDWLHINIDKVVAYSFI